MIRKFSLSRSALVALGAALLLAPVSSSFAAHKKRPVAAEAAPDGSKPQLLGTFDEWSAYVTTGKAKECYALATPKERKPKGLKRDDAHLFISVIPAQHIKNEFSVMMGLPLKDSADGATAQLGSRSFDLIAKGGNAWIKNVAEEDQVVETMKRSGKLEISVPLMKGSTEQDTYILTGFKQALERAQQECK